MSARKAIPAVALAAALLPAAVAQALAPAVFTGGARDVGFNTATLTGSVNPHGEDTTYYFQYGPTRAYGLQTGLADAGAGTTRVAVAIGVSGLQPLTRYHYRLVAVNSSGVIEGLDKAFLTTKIPLSLQILAAPNPVLYGGSVQIQGTLSGTDNANRQIVLQANPFPYSSGFVDVGNPETTLATGGFSFSLLALTTSTQFRVVTTTRTPVVSPVVTANVAVRIAAHIRHARRRHHARIVGTVTPALDGMRVAIMRVVHGQNKLVAGTILRHLNSHSSRFASRVLRVRRGLYRVLVVVTNGAQVSNYSGPLLIR